MCLTIFCRMAEFRSVGDNAQKLRLKIPVQIRRLRTKEPVDWLVKWMSLKDFKISCMFLQTIMRRNELVLTVTAQGKEDIWILYKRYNTRQTYGQNLVIQREKIPSFLTYNKL